MSYDWKMNSPKIKMSAGGTTKKTKKKKTKKKKGRKK